MRIHYFQHVPFEGLALIEEWTVSRNHTLTNTCFFQENYTIPKIDEFDMLIIMGGPMSTNDEKLYPWLIEEKACVKQAIDAGKYVLGICLGAQIIAQTLGADVAPMKEKEIGWHPIAFTDQVVGHPLLSGLNYAMTVLHWHGERFEIPTGAIQIASSEACDNQGFLYDDKVLALQFHIEMDEVAIEKIIEACAEELDDGKFMQSKEVIIEGANKHHLKYTLFQLLNNWIDNETSKQQ